MLVSRIIDALRTLVMHLRFGVRCPTSTSYPSSVQELSETKSTLSEPSLVTREDPGSDSALSSASTIYSEAPDDCDGPSDEQFAGGLLNDDYQSAESISDSVHNSPDSAVADPESALSSAGGTGQPPSILVEVEHEESGSSPSSTNEDTRHTESLGQQPGTGHEPFNTGGKRGKQTTKPQPKPKQPPSSHPELVCRKVHGSGMWEVVLTADDECLLSAVHLESKALCPSNKECRVPSLKGHLVVSCQNGTKHDIPLFGNEPLIFKLRKTGPVRVARHPASQTVISSSSHQTHGKGQVMHP